MPTCSTPCAVNNSIPSRYPADCVGNDFVGEFDTVGVDDADRVACPGAGRFPRLVMSSWMAPAGCLVVSGGSGNGRSASSDPSRVRQAPFKTGAHLPVPHSARHV